MMDCTRKYFISRFKNMIKIRPFFHAAVLYLRSCYGRLVVLNLKLLAVLALL